MATINEGPVPEEVLAGCVAALRRVAEYRLPAALARRLLWLSENKERLSEAEREDLLAVVELSEGRTLEKLQAQAVLQRLARLYPHLVAPPA
jgi:hypothetical protein